MAALLLLCGDKVLSSTVQLDVALVASSFIKSFIIVGITTITALVVSKASGNSFAVGGLPLWVFIRKGSPRKKGVLSTGCFSVGVITVRGEVSDLTEDELKAVIQHEVYHLKNSSAFLRLLIVSLMGPIFTPAGAAGILFLWGMFMQSGYVSEMMADRCARARCGSTALLSAIEKLSGENERLYEIAECIPFVNVLFLTHPCLAFRRCAVLRLGS